MKDFDYEVLQRKRIAQQAKYRKNGSRSKKCSLPSDGMSHREWKERNGEVVEYNLNKPMSYERFKLLPKDVQHQYIRGLQERFGVAVAVIATELFGICKSALSTHFARSGIKYEQDSRIRTSIKAYEVKQLMNVWVK